MEGLYLIFVLVTALLVGVESERPDQEQRSVHKATLMSEQGVTGQSLIHLCDPTHQTIVQRDLTVPVDQQINDHDR
jgi:hypothetical protein